MVVTDTIIYSYVIDTCNIQEFEVSCGREVNGTTGLITASLQWSILPVDLPYSSMDGLNFISVGISDATSLSGQLSRLREVIIDAVGEKEEDLSQKNLTQPIRAVITLEEDVSGSLILNEVVPRNAEPSAIHFEVAMKTNKLGLGHWSRARTSIASI